MSDDEQEQQEYDFSNIFRIIVQLCAWCWSLLSMSNERAARDRRERCKFWPTTAVLADEEFRVCFRMNRNEFKALVDSVRLILTCYEKMSALRNGIIAPEVDFCSSSNFQVWRFSIITEWMWKFSTWLIRFLYRLMRMTPMFMTPFQHPKLLLLLIVMTLTSTYQVLVCI